MNIAAIKPVASSRYASLDGLRGIFLIFMLIVHLNEQFKTVIGKLNHHYFGWVEDAQGFVFISGLVVGLVYGSILLEKGDAHMVRALVKRCKTIFFYQASLILLLAFTIVIFGNSIDSHNLSNFKQNVAAYTLIALTMISVPTNMGILPMYLAFMAATPFVLRQFKQGNFILVLTVSVLLWCFSQTGLTGIVCENIEHLVLKTFNFDLSIGIFFNLFAWQVVYFLGLFFGYKVADKSIDLSFFSTHAGYQIFIACVVAFILFGIFDRVVFNDLVSPKFSEIFIAQNRRPLFTPVYLVNFLVDLYIVAWLLIVGRNKSGTIIGHIGRIMHWSANWKPLVFLGQHSLQVFAFHIVVQYALFIALDDQSAGEIRGSLIILAGVLSLFIPAYLHAQYIRFKSVKHVAKLPQVPRVRAKDGAS